ncbi:MAG: hypothetical protein CM15mV99_130 [Caudoviricetes sp.]|nr:MAG: hypothetical protein CM15mV99_130 [Caudoviricetes sp.]
MDNFLITQVNQFFPNGGAGKVVAKKFASSSTNEQNPSGNTTWTLVGAQITHTAKHK